MKLFATDLDGTLLDRLGRVQAKDRAAIDRARARGVIVTIATGRLTSGTHPIASELGLDAPLVCADGAVTTCGATQRILDHRPVETARAEAILEMLAGIGLASFVFTHDAIHSCERGRDHHAYVSGWTPDIHTHSDVVGAEAWKATPDAAIMVVGIGRRDGIDDAVAALADVGAGLEIMRFSLGPGRPDVVRVLAAGVSKGAALAALAARLGVEQRDVAVIGDWLNDVSMFEWAGRSFAMPHAPEEVAARASDRLGDDSYRKGPVADALDRWLGDDPS